MTKISPAKGVQFKSHNKGKPPTLITWVTSVILNYEAAISFKKQF